MKTTAHNPSFASSEGPFKLGALCFYSSVVQLNSFMLRNLPLHNPLLIATQKKTLPIPFSVHKLHL